MMSYLTQLRLGWLIWIDELKEKWEELFLCPGQLGGYNYSK